MLKAVSDKPHGLNGFLNETIADLRHVVSTVQSANEIGIIKKEQVINIIDSVVQRTSFSFGEEVSSVNIDGSVMQRTEFTLDKDETQLEEVEKRYKERKAKENNEIKVQKEGENKKYQLQVWDGNSNKKFVFVTLLLGMSIVSYWLITLENNDSALPLLNSTINQTHEKTTIVALTNLTASAEKSTAKVNSTISITNEDNQEILETSST